MRAQNVSAATLMIVASLWVTTAGGVQPPPSYSGSADYETYCASCHGQAARGDGVIAKSLRKPPPDLTQLTKRANGTFPDERVYAIIEGRTPVTAHRGSDMPPWGEVFAKASGSTSAADVAARITALVAHLKTLQR